MFEVHERLPVCHDIKGPKARTKDVILEDEVKFSSLLLEEQIQKGLARCGYHLLSPIQRNTLPLALTGQSIIAHAKSGTGKTLIYLLTALNTYLKTKPKDLFALILAPTREIAKQIYDVCKNISHFIEDLKIEFFIGGISVDIDLIKCKTCHIAVGAPGRIKHLISLRELKVQGLQLLVLDEVDVLVNNKEFAIGDLVSALPSSRQTIVCTATYTDDIGVLLKPISLDLKYINTNEEDNRGNTSFTSNVLIGIKQYALTVFSDSSPLDNVRKRNKLVEVLKNFTYDQCFVFVNYISLVKSVYNFLLSHNLSVMWLSSEQNQSTRIATLNKLKLNECKILVTTDLAARGIDVHNANLVVNLGTPMPPEVYVHRMGRAGRYGSEGSVITIVHEGDELQTFINVIRHVITEPVNLYMMPKEINAETLNSSLEMIGCDPQPNSSIVREFIAKYASKISSQPKEAKSKKRKNRKRKVKDKALDECGERSSTMDDASSVCDMEVSESKPTPMDVRDLRKRFDNYTDILRHELNENVPIDIDLNALKQFIDPEKSPPSRLIFTDYFTEPIAEKKCDTFIRDEKIDESLLHLADFSRKTNAYIDSQKIPLSIPEFFALVDHDGVLSDHTDNDSVRELKKQILERLRELLGPRASPEEQFSNATDSGIKIAKSTPTCSTDSQEPPIKFRPTRQRTTDLKSAVDRHEPAFPSSILASSRQPLLDDNPLNALSSVTTPWNTQEEMAFRTADTVLQNEQSLPIVSATNVQCPQCHHRFSVHLDSAGNSERHNTLASLTQYVSPEIEEKIYQSHFNYITSCIQRAQPPHLYN